MIRSVKNVLEEHKIYWLLEKYKRDKRIDMKPSLDKCRASMKSWPRHGPREVLCLSSKIDSKTFTFFFTVAELKGEREERKLSKILLISLLNLWKNPWSTLIYSIKPWVNLGMKLLVESFEEKSSYLTIYLGILRYYTKNLSFSLLFCHLSNI